MKIKSWNGEEVEVRVGMVVCYRNKSEINGAIFEISDAGCFVDWNCYGVGYLDCDLTMLHCPFQVGDEIEVFDEAWFDAFKTDRWVHWGSGCPDDNMMKRFRFRHASRALRDSPEYKP